MKFQENSMKPMQLKPGQVVVWENELCTVLSIRQVRPAARPAFYQVEMKNLLHGSVLQHRFNEDAVIEGVYIENKKVQYLYRDGNDHVFMDTTTYEQFNLPETLIKDQLPYMTFNMELRLAMSEKGVPLYLELPASVVLTVVETEPGARGDTVSNVLKRAKLQTGLEIKVPLHIKQGEKVKVDTRSGEFIERAN
jgi:elongation factor P